MLYCLFSSPLFSRSLENPPHFAYPIAHSKICLISLDINLCVMRVTARILYEYTQAVKEKGFQLETPAHGSTMLIFREHSGSSLILPAYPFSDLVCLFLAMLCGKILGLGLCCIRNIEYCSRRSGLPNFQTSALLDLLFSFYV